MTTSTALRALLPVSLLWASTAAAGPTPTSDDDKTLYAIGIAISRNLTPFDLTSNELALVQAGIADGVAGKSLSSSEEAAIGGKINELLKQRTSKAAAVEKKEAESFLSKAASEKGAKKLDSGLIYTEIKAGDGKQPKAADRVSVNYRGTLRDGSTFDSSYDRGKPAEFPVHGVIPCWTEALQMMKEHGKAKLVCPSEIAYGDQGAPPKIKPGAPLVFEIELLEVKQGVAVPNPHEGAADPHGDSGAMQAH